MGVAQRSRRWLVPVTAVAVVAGVAALGPVVADASPNLPGITAQDLLAKVQTAKVDGLSGTVSSSLDLGLPAIPGLVGGENSSQFTDLLSGQHTARVAFAGPDKARVSVLDSMAERVLTTDGKTAWIYDSSKREATKVAVPAHQQQAAPQNEAYDPQATAKKFLAAIDPSTTVAVTGTESVAGRDAYKLRLTPKTDKSTVGSVTVAVDSKNWVPLQVTVMPRTGNNPAIQVGFSSVSFSVPSANTFTFTPPHGVKVTDQQVPARTTEPQGAPKALPKKPGATKPSGDQPTVVGTGWDSVAVIRNAKLPSGNGALDQLLAKAPTVSGSWGSGKILTTKMVSALIANDGRVFVGLVSPDTLQAAAAKAPR
jgi:outer membrane lipoprotein-sorting protein